MHAPPPGAKPYGATARPEATPARIVAASQPIDPRRPIHPMTDSQELTAIDSPRFPDQDAAEPIESSKRRRDGDDDPTTIVRRDDVHRQPPRRPADDADASWARGVKDASARVADLQASSAAKGRGTPAAGRGQDAGPTGNLPPGKAPPPQSTETRAAGRREVTAMARQTAQQSSRLWLWLLIAAAAIAGTLAALVIGDVIKF
jgi:hypothetical protein